MAIENGRNIFSRGTNQNENAFKPTFANHAVPIHVTFRKQRVDLRLSRRFDAYLIANALDGCLHLGSVQDAVAVRVKAFKLVLHTPPSLLSIKSGELLEQPQCDLRAALEFPSWWHASKV